METVWMCGFKCGFNSNEEETVKNHQNFEHGLKCKICKFATLDFEVLERHMINLHNKPLTSNCKICNEAIDGLDEFDKHLQYTHGTNHWDLNLASKDVKRKLKDMEDEVN